MKQILHIILALFALSMSAQETVSFIQDTRELHNIQSIQKESFAPIVDSNYGLDNGIFWFKISQIDQAIEVLTLPSNHAESLQLFDSNSQAIPIMANTRYPSFTLNDQIHEFPLYLKANFQQEAYFPIQIVEAEKFISSEKYDLLGTGIYYGAIIALILATFVFFFITKKRVFLFHALLALVIALTIVAKDNLFYLLNIDFAYFVHLELFSHFLVGFFGLCFVYLCINLNSHKKRFGYILIITTSFSMLTMLAFFATFDMVFFFISDLFTLGSILTVWLIGMFKIKRKSINWFLGTVYVINIFLIIEVFLLHTIGNTFLGLSITAAKYCALLDVVLITFAMMYTFRKMKHKESLMKQQVRHYFQRLETLDQYKKAQDEDDTYLETLINEFGLANVEVKILQGISNGHSYNHIASDYNMSEDDVAFAAKSLFHKLGIEADREIRVLVS